MLLRARPLEQIDGSSVALQAANLERNRWAEAAVAHLTSSTTSYQVLHDSG